MSLPHAILGFLDLKPMTGYDLKKHFDASVTHFWTAAQSHIYKELEELEKMGWAQAQIIPQAGKPNRKEYQITNAGRAELRRWLVTPLPLDPVREGWLIQVFFSHSSSSKEIIALLEARIWQLRQKIALLRSEVQSELDANADQIGVERIRQLWQLTLDYGIDRYDHELRWLEKVLKEIHALQPLMLA
jgi:DNA-binding PadR family transcriptional regulator